MGPNLSKARESGVGGGGGGGKGFFHIYELSEAPFYHGWDWGLRGSGGVGGSGPAPLWHTHLPFPSPTRWASGVNNSIISASATAAVALFAK